MKKRLFLFIAVIFLATVLRAYQLTNVPPSASLDEATIGWNAHSILTTGEDEYGYKFPILLRAYDDWRPALYVYLVVPFIKLLGLNVLAVRIPSIILGALTVLTTYFLVKELFIKYKYKDHLGLLSAFFLSISPWHVYISRLGHEVNAGFAFGIFAIFFFLKFKNSLKNIYLYSAAIFFSLSFYAYQAEKIFIPLIVAILAVIFRKEILQRKKSIIFAVLIAAAILLPVLQETLSEKGLARFRGTSAFDVNQSDYVNAAKERLVAKQDKNLIKEVVSNNRIISLQIFAGNYISHFDPRWLFTNPGVAQFKAPGIGLLYLFEFPLILVGLLYLFRNFDKKTKIFLAGWILASPIAASFTTGTPHAMRSYNFLPTFQILSSLGLICLVLLIKKDILRKIFVFTASSLIIVSVAYFCKQYFVVFPKEQSSSFQYAVASAIRFVLQNDQDYSKIVLANTDNLYQSYMFFLFYSKYDPFLYSKQGGTRSGGFAEVHSFGKYEFNPINPNKIVKGTLYLGNIHEFPRKIKRLAEFKNLDGETAIVAIYKK